MYSVTRMVFNLRLWGDRLGSTDVSEPNFIALLFPLTGLGTAFFSVLNASFFYVLLKNATFF